MAKSTPAVFKTAKDVITAIVKRDNEIKFSEIQDQPEWEKWVGSLEEGQRDKPTETGFWTVMHEQDLTDDQRKTYQNAFSKWFSDDDDNFDAEQFRECMDEYNAMPEWWKKNLVEEKTRDQLLRELSELKAQLASK